MWCSHDDCDRDEPIEVGQLDLGLESSDRRHLFEEVCLKRTLERAFRKVKANRGAPGPDGETLEEFERDLENGRNQLRDPFAAEQGRGPAADPPGSPDPANCQMT